MSCAGIAASNYGKITNCKVIAKLNNCVKYMGVDEVFKFQLPETGGITSFNTGLVSGCTLNRICLMKTTIYYMDQPEV